MTSDFRTAPEAGQLSDLVQKQIVGGVDASLGQFPWQAFIYIDNAYLCGGSLILANWVMTAAHCAQGLLNFKYSFLNSLMINYLPVAEQITLLFWAQSTEVLTQLVTSLSLQ